MHPKHDQDDGFEDEIGELIASINASHLWELRVVRGKDLTDHMQQLIEWEADRRYSDALELLEEIIKVTHRLPQYDVREPQSYWPMKAASLYLRINQPDQATRVLTEWLESWPESRGKQPDRVRVRARITKIMNKHI